jgi:hypothetical protein
LDEVPVEPASELPVEPQDVSAPEEVAVTPAGEEPTEGPSGEVFVVTKPATAQETRRARVARQAREAKQGDLPLDHSTHGIFDKHERVIVNGQDLDQPTYLRLGLRLQRTYR